MFDDFQQEANEERNCVSDCSHKYILQARCIVWFHYDLYLIKGEIIVTQIKLFYKRVQIYLDEGAY